MNFCGHFPESKVKFHLDVVLGKMLQPEAKGPNDVLVPYIRAANVNWGSIDFENLKEMWFSPRDLQKYRVQSNDLLVLEGGDVGRAAILTEVPVTKPVGIQNSIHRVRPKLSNSIRFAYYWMSHLKFSGYFELVCSKATLAHFTAEKFSETPYPRLDEETQKAIASFLDRKTAAIDDLIAKKERLIELLEKKQAALINRAVTKGLDPDVPMKDSGIPWIGEIPEHWEAVRGRYLLNFHGGYAPEDVIEDSNGIPYFKVADLERGKSELVISKVQRRVLPNRLKLVPKKTILFPKRGAAIFTNKVSVTSEPSVFDSNIMGLTIRLSADVSFIAFSLWARGLEEVADVSTVPQINNKHIAEVTFPLPPEEEQSEIAKYILSCDEYYGEIDKLLRQQCQRLMEYRQSLITAAVTGQIDVPFKESKDFNIMETSETLLLEEANAK